MSILPLLLVALSGFPEAPGLQNGAIGGGVVNAADQKPVAGAKVVLRIKLQGQFAPLSETTTNEDGKFLFKNLFVGEHYEYLLGANRDDVHYPGSPVTLAPDDPYRLVKLEVCDSVTEPCPLVIRQHVIVVHPRPGAVHVTESILVDNPSKTCYVGRPTGKEEEEPVTLQLALPLEVQSTTFRDEFFGRRFFVRDGRPATGIPWTPGQRELRFTYVLPNDQESFCFERPLDLPCDRVELRVKTEEPDKVACSLPRAAESREGEIAFVSDGPLSAGYALTLQLGDLPVPWMTYGRWAAVAALGLMVAAAGAIWLVRSRRRPGETSPDEAPATLPMDTRKGRKSGRKGKSSRGAA